MNDEKRLPDETVKDVAGGTIHRAPQKPYYMFYNTNCKFCPLPFHREEQQGEPSCPYNDPVDAFMQLNGADCPSKQYNT